MLNKRRDYLRKYMSSSQNKYFYKIKQIKKEKNIKEDIEHRYRYKEFNTNEKKLSKICTFPILKTFY